MDNNIFTDLGDFEDGIDKDIVKTETKTEASPAEPVVVKEQAPPVEPVKTTNTESSLFSDLMNEGEGGTVDKGTASSGITTDTLMERYQIPKDSVSNIDELAAAIEAKIEARLFSETNDDARVFNNLINGSDEDRVKHYVEQNAKTLLLNSKAEILDKIDEILDNEIETEKVSRKVEEEAKAGLTALKTSIAEENEAKVKQLMDVKKYFEQQLKDYKLTNHKTGQEELLPQKVQNMVNEYFWGEGFLKDIQKDPVGFVLKIHPQLSGIYEKNIGEKHYQRGVKESIAGLENTELKIGKGGGTYDGKANVATASSIEDIF